MNTLSRLTGQLCLRRQIKALRPVLYRLAWSWCHDEHLAEDLVQETLVRALERIHQLREPEQLKPWLCRILSNLHKDCLRARRDCVDCDEVDLAAEHTPETELRRMENISQVRAAIACLGNEQRKVLTLVDLMEFSYADVAQILDIPVGTVMSRLSRARGRLKELLSAPSEPLRPALRRVK